MEFANRTEWRYIYNNSSAREQKRMHYNPAGITGNNLYPWQYTLLDAGNKESVLYAGFVNADPVLACTDGTNYVNSDSAVLQSWVTPPQYTKQSLYIAPVEFYANGLMSWKVDANNQWQRSYKVLDHLGNVRVEGIGWANEYRADYRPFGGTEWTNSNINNKTSYRLGFLGLQKDKESNLGDNGVRKYDSEIGRFLAIDPLWEKYNTLNPYQYSGNSPVSQLDKNGMFFITTHWDLDFKALKHLGMSFGKYISSFEEQLLTETFDGINYGPMNYKPIKHLDNMDNAQFSKFLSEGGYNSLNRHQTQDFYSHSNYVEIMMEEGYNSKNIPTFDRLNKDSDIYKKVMSKIRTSIYPDNKQLFGHDGELLFENQETMLHTSNNFRAKDEPYTVIKGERFNNPYFAAAYNTALKVTVIWYNKNR